MIQSMTGYGEARESGISCEIKSLNHKGFVTNFIMPEYLQSLEVELRNLLHSRLKRGAISYRLIVEVSPKFEIDWHSAEELIKLIFKLEKTFGLAGRLPPNFFYQNVIRTKYEFNEEIKKKIIELTEKAIEKLIEMRKREGQRIEKELEKELKKLEGYLKEIEEKGGELRNKIDFSEECSRLRFHISGFRELMKREEPCGHALNFLLQEMLREANTIAAKGQDAEISKNIVMIKEKIMQLKEHVENVL